MTTTVQLVKEGEEKFSLNTTILLLTTSQKFKVGEEKDITTLDGRKVKNVFTLEGSKLTEKQIGIKSLIIERLFSENQLVVTSTIDNVVCTSWGKVVA
jgi:hypothetical protein